MSVIFPADYDSSGDDSFSTWDDDASFDPKDIDTGGGSAASAAAASEAAALASFDQDAKDAAQLAQFTPVAAPAKKPGGPVLIKPVYTVQNPNASAGASVNSPLSAISATSSSPHATPTLVQPKTTGGNHVLFIVLLLALVWFEWGRK